MKRRFGCRVGFRRRPFAVVAAGLLLAACQPSFEERLSSAQRYVAGGDYAAAIIELKNALREVPDDPGARVLIADASYHLADFPAAADEYTRALELGDDSVHNWIGLSKALLRMGRAAEALERVQPNLDEASDDPEELVALAHIYATLGNAEDARTLFERALALDAGTVDALLGLAVLAAGREDIPEAMRLVDKAIEADPTAPRPWLVRGNLEQVRGNTESAVEAYQQAVSREQPTMPLADRFDTRAALASAAIDAEQFEVARAELPRLELMFPGIPTLSFLRGQLAFAEGDAETATSELQRYLADVPDDLRAHAVMGAISFRQNYYSQAERYLERAVRGDVGGEMARRLLAETRIRLNRPGDAIDLLGADRDIATADPELLGMLGRAEFDAGNREAALGYLEQARQAAPTDPQINLLYATAMIAEGRNDEAIAVLDDIPGDADTFEHRREFLLIVAHVRSGEIARANAAALELIESHPEDAVAHALVGSFKRGTGRSDEALAHYHDALRFDPANQSALFGLASIAMESGDTATAEQSLSAILDDYPADMSALSMLAQILVPRREFEAFDSRLAAAMESAPQSPGPPLLKARFDLLRGDPDSSLDTLRVARERFPDLASLRHVEGLALLQLGRMESALVSLARAAAAAPENSGYQLDLALARLDTADFSGARDAVEVYRTLQPEDPTGLAVEIDALIGDRLFADAHRVLDGYDAADADAELVESILRGDLALAEGKADLAVEFFESVSRSQWNHDIVLKLAAAYQAAAVTTTRALELLERWLAENPGDAVVRRAYGQMLHAGGDSSQAIAEYEKVLEANANDPVALNNLAWEYAQAGRDGALELAEQAYDLRRDHGSIADTYGWILHLDGESRQALGVLRRAVELSPDNGDIQYHLAVVLAELGQTSEANRILTRLLESDLRFSSRDEAATFAESME